MCLFIFIHVNQYKGNIEEKLVSYRNTSFRDRYAFFARSARRISYRDGSDRGRILCERTLKNAFLQILPGCRSIKPLVHEETRYVFVLDTRPCMYVRFRYVAMQILYFILVG